MVRVSRRGGWPLSSPALPPSPHLLSASQSVGDHEPALCCLCHAVALCAAGLAFARRGFDMSPARWPLLASPPALLPLHLQSAPPSADGRKRTVLPAWGCAQRRGERVTCADNMFTAPLTLCVSPCASRAGRRMRSSRAPARRNAVPGWQPQKHRRRRGRRRASIRVKARRRDHAHGRFAGQISRIVVVWRMRTREAATQAQGSDL